MSKLKKSIPLVLVSYLFISIFIRSNYVGAKKIDHNPAIKNVILLIGDGMGPSYLTAYRYYKDDPNTAEMEKTLFDNYFVGMQHTYSYDTNENITDSAAAGTALATGMKTYKGAIAVDMNGNTIPTILEKAKELSKSTGIVVTSQVNHATPASFIAHHENRRKYNAIADQYFDGKINGQHKVDIILGGGYEYFKRDSRDLVNEFINDGYQFVKNREELMNSNQDKILGLFADVGLPKAIDRSDHIPSLPDMTIESIKHLNTNPNGFFLLVEGSQIDWAGHDNDIVGVMSEMEEFEKAFQQAINFAKEDKHTLVIATADHSTGGLSIGNNGNYRWNQEIIKNVKHSSEFMAKEIIRGQKVNHVLNKYVNFPLTEDEILQISSVNLKDEKQVIKAISKVISDRSYTGWSTDSHSGVDVEVYAYGPQSDLFYGMYENTDISNKIFKILETPFVENKITDKEIKQLNLKIGEKNITINGEETELEVSPLLLENGKTMVPVRLLENILDAKIKWDQKSLEVIISYD